MLFLDKRGASHEAGSNDWQTPLEPWPWPETSILLRSDAEERIGDTPFLGKKNPSFDEISAFVDAQVKERLEDMPEGQKVVYLKADTDLEYSEVMKVMDLLREAGVEELALIAESRVQGS